MKKRIECTISGRVQMVMYRDFAVRKARNLGVVGKVENKADGTVAVVGEGDEEKLLLFIEEMKRGSLLSHVEHVDVLWKEPTQEFNNFTLHY